MGGLYTPEKSGVFIFMVQFLCDPHAEVKVAEL